MFAEHEAIKREVAVLRQLVETKTVNDRRHEGEEEFGHAEVDDDARSIRTVVPHELGQVEEEDKDKFAQQEDEEADLRRRRTGLGHQNLWLWV